LPVIGTAVGGIPDFLVDNVNGLFSRVDDPKDLAEKITRIANNPELSRRLSENGQKLVKEKYSWNPISYKMNKIFGLLTTYHSLLTKKLLLATGIYPPEIGGPATYAALLEQELPQRGVSVTVLPFRAVRNWPKGLRHFFYFIKSLWLCRRHDLVLAQDTISVGLPSLLAAKLCRKKFIIRVPGDYVWEQSVQRFGVKDSIDDFQTKRYGWRVEFLRRVQKLVVDRADIVITPSEYFWQLVSKWVKNPGKVKVIYNGIDLTTNYSLPTTHSKSKVIISAGRLVPWKGFDFLIELMRDLPDWKLVIAGDGPEYANLKSQISNLKLQDRVELLGQIPRDELMQKMSASDIFILDTSFESFSFQVVEAMSLGLPVVTTNIGNLSEIIENGVDGILVEPNDKKQFLDAIDKLGKDKNFRESISERAKTKAQKFSIENTIRELVNLIQKWN
ncbi:MAG: glycosyltransferase family 4 protein, partial [Patescibacteria group bacterium]